MSLPALPSNPDTRSLAERINVMLRDYNARRSGPITVAELPANPGYGESWLVSDANATTFWSVVAGGGANTVPVKYDGTNWRIG